MTIQFKTDAVYTLGHTNASLRLICTYIEDNTVWKLLDKIQEYQEVEAPLFNNLKGCLKEAIEVYLTEVFEGDNK